MLLSSQVSPAPIIPFPHVPVEHPAVFNLHAAVPAIVPIVKPSVMQFRAPNLVPSHSSVPLIASFPQFVQAVVFAVQSALQVRLPEA